MSVMTNEEITAEFETLFGGSEGSDETETEETETEETTEEETTEDTTDTTETESDESEEEEEDASKDESEAHKETKSSSQQAKQNHAFAEQRLQIKQQEQFIRSIGKLIGFDEKASINDIQDKIKEVLVEKEAKDNNISVELAQKLNWAEEMAQENERIKLEKKVQEDFSELIDKHNLDKEAVDEFTNYLIESGKNPMLDSSVDIAAEYLKLHYEDMVQAAVDKALAKEDARQKKVDEKAASSVSKGNADKGDTKITSVKELDDLFNSMDI
jgi:hypothetical protein